LVDGLLVNGLDGDGAVQNYFNSSMSQEMVYTTSGGSADVSGGGVRLNMIPRDGGNKFAGTVHLNTLPADALVGIPGTALPNRAPTPSTERGVDPQKINSFQARIVWQ